MTQPPAQSDLGLLVEPFRSGVRKLLAALRAEGYDPIAFETLRTRERQEWLYGVGRTHDVHRKPVTWTMHSMHLQGYAVDVISKSRLWDWTEFYDALRTEARKLGMVVLKTERCHVQAY